MTLIHALVYKVGVDNNGVSLLKEQIAVITPYRGQVRAIQKRWSQDKFLIHPIDLKIKVDTVDSF